MRCWEVVRRPPSTKTLHIVFVLKRSWDEKNITQKYKARLVGCGSKDNEIDEECFSNVSDFTCNYAIDVLGQRERLARKAF